MLLVFLFFLSEVFYKFPLSVHTADTLVSTLLMPNPIFKNKLC